MKNGVKEAVQEMKETVSPFFAQGGRQGAFRCEVLCKWAGILEEGIACLPVVFFQTVIDRRNYEKRI